MVMQYCFRAQAGLFLTMVSAVPFLFATIAMAQNDSFQALSTEADALSGLTAATAFFDNASSIMDRSRVSLAGDELQSVRDKVDLAAAVWAQQPELGPSLSGEAAGFIISHGLTKIDADVRPAIAAKWILEPGAMGRLSADAISKLSEAAQSVLTSAQRQQLLSQSHASLGALEGISYKELKRHLYFRTKHLRSEDPTTERESRREFVAEWSAKHDPSAMDLAEVDWLLVQMLPDNLGDGDVREIDASWEADITPPRSGQYTFSISPLNLARTQLENDAKYLNQWLTVEIGGQAVLKAEPEDWKNSGEAIELQQGQTIRVKVSLRYRLNHLPLPATVQLYWTGPGIQRQLVDASFYRLPRTDEPGVKMTVECRDGAGEDVCETTVSSIDQVLGKRSMCDYEQTLAGYIERRVNSFLSPTAMSDAVAQATVADLAKREAHPLAGDTKYIGVLVKSSSRLRQRIAQELALKPELLAPLDLPSIVRFYSIIRFGAEREALDVLGAWMMAHADWTPEMVGGAEAFYEANRSSYRQLTIPLVMEHAESGTWLEDDYLVTEDGKCSLPAAFTLAYAYLVDGRKAEWRERVDTHLADSNLSGDSRVNWLIARAMAEEMRSCPEDRRTFPGCEQIAAGFSWLDEAMLVAKTPEVRARVVSERVARLSALRRWDAAEAELENHPSLAGSRTKLAELRAAAADQRAKDAAAANAAVLAEMRRRHSGAKARGDSAMASKYSAIVQALEDNSKR